MKNVYTFDFFFDADLASRGIIKRTPKVASFLRWAAEEDEEEEVEQEQASKTNVRDVFSRKQNWGIPDETRDAYDYDDAYDFTEKRADLEDLAKDNFWDR